MRTPRKPVAAAMLTTMLLAGAIAFAFEARKGPRDEAVDSIVPTFQVRGKVANLYPGKRVFMKVKVRNGHQFPIVVKMVRARVIAKKLSCPADYVVVRRWRGSKRIPAESFRRVRLRVKLKRSAPPACSGARWTLVYAGRAVQP